MWAGAAPCRVRRIAWRPVPTSTRQALFASRSRSPEESGYAAGVPHPGITTRSARRSDLSWCVAHDGHLGEQALRAKIDRGELFLAEVDGEPAGLLRVDSLWSSVTLIAQVRVLERHRRLGVGRALVDHVAAQ